MTEERIKQLEEELAKAKIRETELLHRCDLLEAELAALKEAARPVVEWYTRSKRHFPDEFRPRDVALEYDGPFGRVVVLCLELDKLVALVGEG